MAWASTLKGLALIAWMRAGPHDSAGASAIRNAKCDPCTQMLSSMNERCSDQLRSQRYVREPAINFQTDG